MTDELSGILTFLNKSFGKFKTINNITEINDAEYLDKVLRDIEQNYFCDMNYLPSDSEFNKQYNLRIIYTRISSFFEYVIKNPLEHNYFDYKDNSPENFLKLSELILGVCAQSKNREIYFEILNDLPENESNEMIKILSNLIPLEEKPTTGETVFNCEKCENLEVKLQETESKLEEKEYETAMLLIRAENAEKENEKMSEEMNELHDKITDLTKSKFQLEINLKENESKYQELVSSLEEGKNTKTKEEDINLSIKVSELKGKLEATKKSFTEYQEEKEKIIEELNIKINLMRKENLTLKETKVKQDVLRSDSKKYTLEDINEIEEKLSQCEKTLKEKEEEINNLKNRDNQKLIEDLNKEKEELQKQLEELQEENESLQQQVLIKECEITQLTEGKGEGGSSIIQEEKKENKIDNDSEKLSKEENKDEEGKEKEKYLELEKKVEELEKEKSNFNEQINELNNNINELNKKIEENQKLIEKKEEEIEKWKKKLERHKQIKEENKTFVSKITDLMEKLDIQKNENIKLINLKNEIKNEDLLIINKLKKDLTASELKIKDMENCIQKLESEKEKNNENNNIDILKDLEINTINTSSDGKLQEIEERLKKLTDKESIDLKQKLKEKELNLIKINEKHKKLETENEELNKAMEKVPEELKKREEAIDYYKSQLEQKEKSYNEEIRILSSLFHRLSFQCAELRLTKESQIINI